MCLIDNSPAIHKGKFSISSIRRTLNMGGEVK